MPARATARKADVHPRVPVGYAQVIADRAVRVRGRSTVARLLAAGLAEFAERGFQAVTVDDIVRRAKASHGTFYLYFTNKDDFFRALSAEALQAMDRLSDEFPVVTADAAGRAALRRWVTAFCDAYAAHATVLRIISHADTAGRDVWEDGLKYLLRMADVVSMGMTVAATGGRNTKERRVSLPGSRLSAVACLMMLERVNYLLSSGIQLPRAELIDRLTAIMAAAFGPPVPDTGAQPRCA